jgi:hypothetical protein
MGPVIRHQQTWKLFAVIAILAAVALLLVPQAHSTHTLDWIVLLPVFFVGLLLPFVLPGSMAWRRTFRLPQPPALAPSFQRPPPSRHR